MLFLGYDPGGKGTHGVAAVRVAPDGALTELVAVDVARDAEAAWTWLSAHTDAVALGIDTLLAWSPRGGRVCDDRLRQEYKAHVPTVIPQNALYSSMTLNGAMVARWQRATACPYSKVTPNSCFARLCCTNSGWAAFAPFPGSLCDTFIGRTTGMGHAVESFDRDPGFSCLTLHFAAAQLRSDDLFVAPELGLAA